MIGKGSQRFSARRQAEVVLRLLWGESLELLSRELGITAARLSSWREQFLPSGQAALKKHPQAGRDLEIARLQQKLGEVTMENELLQSAPGNDPCFHFAAHRQVKAITTFPSSLIPHPFHGSQSPEGSP